MDIEKATLIALLHHSSASAPALVVEGFSASQQEFPLRLTFDVSGEKSLCDAFGMSHATAIYLGFTELIATFRFNVSDSSKNSGIATCILVIHETVTSGARGRLIEVENADGTFRRTPNQYDYDESSANKRPMMSILKNRSNFFVPSFQVLDTNTQDLIAKAWPDAAANKSILTISISPNSHHSESIQATIH